MSQIAAPVAAGRGRTAVSAHRGSGALAWLAPAAVLVVAAAARLIGLGFPMRLVFDETYYVKDAWTLWHLGYEGHWPAVKPDPAFEAGRVSGYDPSAVFVAHPPLGKWMIGLGEVLAGGAQHPFGWRIAVAVAGILAVALLMVIVHRMFRTLFVTVVAGGLFAIDNQAITMSRVSLLDNLVMLTALVGFACVLEDRIFAERRLGAWMMRRRRGAGAWGPTQLWRPWLVAGGVAFGACTAVKWSGIYFLVAFAVYAVGCDLLLRRRAGVRFWAAGGLLKQAPLIALGTVVPALGAYLVSWTGWFVTSGGYHRHWVESADGAADRFHGWLAWVPLPLQNLWSWHTEIYRFHTGLSIPHAYESPAILWPLLARPTFMFWGDVRSGCPDGLTCAISDVPNPLIWFAGVAASLYLLVRFVRRREWQAGLILMGFVGGYLPWLLYPNRTMFFFYSIAFEPYLIMALAATIGLLVMRPAGPDLLASARSADAESGLRARRAAVAVFLAAAVLVSVFFLPISTGFPEPLQLWQWHNWSRTWV